MTYCFPTTPDRYHQVSEVSSVDLKALLEGSDVGNVDAAEFYADMFGKNSKTNPYCEDDDSSRSAEEAITDPSNLFSNYANVPVFENQSAGSQQTNENITQMVELRAMPFPTTSTLEHQELKELHHGSTTQQQTSYQQLLPNFDALPFLEDEYDPKKRKELRSENTLEAAESSPGNNPIPLTRSVLLENLEVCDEIKTATDEALRQNSTTPLTKQGLKDKIQLKRLQEGKRELKVSFEPKTKHEMRPEEKEKMDKRKHMNRQSAKKSRQKSKQRHDLIVEEHEIMERENKRLKSEIENLEIAKKELAQVLSNHLSSCPMLHNKQQAALPCIEVDSTSAISFPTNNGVITSLSITTPQEYREEQSEITTTTTEDLLDLISPT